jgi:hypothetical protein
MWFKQKGGFWFPALVWLIDKGYRRTSLGHGANRLAEKRCVHGPWVSEAYQFFVVLVGIAWIVLLRQPALTARGWVLLGAAAALYRPFEILLFGLHWLFVADKPVERYTRSLAGFLVNLGEIMIFFPIAFFLLDSYVGDPSRWSAVAASWRAILNLEATSLLADQSVAKILGWTQVLIAWILLVLILGNVVGAIQRGQKSSANENAAV